LSDYEKKVAVVGVGNILMGDEGIGVKVMEAVKKKVSAKGVEFFDAGTALHALLPQLEGYKKMIVLDSVRGSELPGTAYRFTYQDLKKKRHEEPARGHRLSLHDVGIEETLSMAALTQDLPDEIIFIGIEPEKIELSESISQALQERMDEYVGLVEKELPGSGD
jgi:hydrogenase maturation protease